VPGPGAYNTLEVELLKQKGASFSIGKSAKMQTINERQILNVPGPERYNITLGAFEQKGSAIFGR
jgi:hypothetical protein